MAGRGRDAPIGGQAVLEGVMMRGIRTWSVAVRAPTEAQLESQRREVPQGAIAVRTFPFTSALRAVLEVEERDHLSGADLVGLEVVA